MPTWAAPTCSTGPRGIWRSWYNNVVLVMYADTIEANITVSGAATPGYRDVSVTTPEGTDTAVNGFVVLGIPGISSLSPSQETQGQTTNVIITGANLFGATAVDFGGGITVNSFSVDSGTQITASITIGSSATPGVRDVSVTNAAGTATLAGGFTVNQAPPTLASVNPNQGVQGQTLDVTLTGTSFTGATSVSFGADITVNSYTVDGNTQVTASITIGGSAAPGLRDVSLTTPGGTDTLPNGFTVLGIPAITLANPNQGAQGQTLGVTVSGSNLTGATSVSFGADVTTNSFTVDSATQITANISIGAGATPGMRDVSVTAPGGTATLTNGFIVLAVPTLASVTPCRGRPGTDAERHPDGHRSAGSDDRGLRRGHNRQQLHRGQLHPDNGQHQHRCRGRAGRQGRLGDQCRRDSYPDQRFHGRPGAAGDCIAESPPRVSRDRPGTSPSPAATSPAPPR